MDIALKNKLEDEFKARLENEKIELAGKIEVLRARALAENLPLVSEKIIYARTARIEIIRGGGREFFALYAIHGVDNCGAEKSDLYAMINCGLIASKTLAEIATAALWQ